MCINRSILPVLACLVLCSCAPSPDEARQILASPGASGERIEAAEVLFTAASPDDLGLLASTLNDFDEALVSVVQRGLASLAHPAEQESVIRSMAEQGVPPEVAAPVLRAYGEHAFEVLLATAAPSADLPSAWQRVDYLSELEVPAARAMLAAGFTYTLVEGDYSLRQQAVESLIGDAARAGPFLEDLLTRVQGEIGASGDISVETAARMGVRENPEEASRVEIVRDYLATAAMMLYRIDPQRHAELVTATLLLSGPPDFGAEYLKPLASAGALHVLKMIQSEDVAARRRAVALAGMWGLAEAASELRAIMTNDHEDPELRGQAALALSALRDAETLQLLPEVLRQAHDAEDEWSSYNSETNFLAAEKERCNTDSASSESDENIEDDSGSDSAEQAEDEYVDDEDWGCEEAYAGDWEDAEPLEQPPWPDGDYEQLHRDLLRALIAYGDAALPALWQGLGGDDVAAEDAEFDEDGDGYAMAYVSSSEARDAVAEIAPAIEVLLAAWEESNRAVRVVLLDSLGASEDPRAMEALQGELQDALENSASEWGYADEEEAEDDAFFETDGSYEDEWLSTEVWGERLVLALHTAPRPPLTRLLEWLRAEELSQQLAAVKVLRELQSSEGVFDALLETIQSTHAPVRMEAVQSFGQSLDRRALESLVHQLEVEDQIEVKTAIADVLHLMPDERALPGLMKALANLGEWDSAETFARAVGDIKDVARAPVLALYETGTVLQRRNALLALAYVDPLEADRRAGEWFDRLVAGPVDYDVSDDFQQVVEVLVIASQPDGARRMVGFLRAHPQDERRMEVVMAIKDHPDPQVNDFLMEAVQHGDIELVAAAYEFFIRAGSGEAQLMEALDEYGDKEMANVFLNCGNSRLEKAATDWVEDRGGFILWTPGTTGSVSWGGPDRQPR